MLRIPKSDSLSWHIEAFLFSQRVLFYWPIFSLMSFGAPGVRGPRFIEPPEPPVATPLLGVFLDKHKAMKAQLENIMIFSLENMTILSWYISLMYITDIFVPTLTESDVCWCYFIYYLYALVKFCICMLVFFYSAKAGGVMLSFFLSFCLSFVRFVIQSEQDNSRSR